MVKAIFNIDGFYNRRAEITVPTNSPREAKFLS